MSIILPQFGVLVTLFGHNGDVGCKSRPSYDYFYLRFLMAVEQNSIWARNLPGPMHLGLKIDPLCPII